jgi:hypothetical protein
MSKVLLQVLCVLPLTGVPEAFIGRLRQPRQCWNCDGEIQPFPLPLARLGAAGRCLVDVERGLEILVQRDYISVDTGSLARLTFSARRDVREQVKATIQDHPGWRWSCLKLGCHAFPGTVEEIA